MSEAHVPDREPKAVRALILWGIIGLLVICLLAVVAYFVPVMRCKECAGLAGAPGYGMVCWKCENTGSMTFIESLRQGSEDPASNPCPWCNATVPSRIHFDHLRVCPKRVHEPWTRGD